MQRTKKRCILIVIISIVILGMGLCFLLTTNIKENSKSLENGTVYFHFEDSICEISVMEDVVPGSSITLPIATSSYRTFKGWSDTPTGTIYTVTYTVPKKSAFEVTLYARWKIYSYYINYNSNNGSNLSTKVTYKSEEENVISNSYWTYDNSNSENINYSFVGWTTLPSSKKVKFSPGYPFKNLLKTSGATLTLYAVWRETYYSHYQKPSGTGTIDDPYLIANDKNLAWLSFYTNANKLNFEGYCKQVADIDMSDFEWIPICSVVGKAFEGVFDGQGYKISNLYMRGYGTSYAGLFACVRNAEIKNVVIASGEIGARGFDTYSSSYMHLASSNVGSLIGSAENSIIKNCVNLSSVNFGIYFYGSIGGLIGWAEYCEILKCSNYGNVYGGSTVAGIVAGTYRSKVIGCYANCKIAISKENPDSSSNPSCMLSGISNPLRTFADNNDIIDSCVFEGILERGNAYYKGGTYLGSVYMTNKASAVTATNCYGKVQVDIDMGNQTQLYKNANSCITEVNGEKIFVGEDFSGWILIDDKLIPRGMTWYASVIDEYPSTTKLQEMGYVKSNYFK